MDDRDVVAWLKSDPEDDADPETYRRIAQQLRFRRRTWLTWAAAAAIVVVAGSLLLKEGRQSKPTQPPSLVAQLEEVLKQGRGKLDPATQQVLETSIQQIDVAIRQAEQALAADTSNEFVARHLAQLREAKLKTLRDAAGVVRAKL